jgi:SAM-dependent methyltransferase
VETEALYSSVLVRRALELTRRRFPRAYCHARNGKALVGWWRHAIHSRTSPESADPYDESFWDALDPASDWDGFARLLLREFEARSIVDVGCGDGRVLAAFARANPDLALWGVDSSPAGIRRAGVRGVEVELFDVASLPPVKAREVQQRLEGAGLALCLEVAEHLPWWRWRTLLALLGAAHRVVFSGAQPFQGGVFHVNEQPEAYWIECFVRQGFHLSDADDSVRSALRGLVLPPWYANNIHVFER